MNRRRRPRNIKSPTPQLTLAIDTPSGVITRKGSPPTRQGVRERPRREIDTDQLLSTADVARILGKHRTTLYRWVKQKWFPAKAVRQGRPVGWLKSEVDRYLAGTTEELSTERRSWIHPHTQSHSREV